MTVLHVAHRAGNDLGLLAPALALGADLLEADVHLRRGRLEVRHAKSLGPAPWLWEPWYRVPDIPLHLHELRAATPAAAMLLLDLKGWQPWLGRRIVAAMRGAGAYAVCTRHWRLLEAFATEPDVRVVHSVRTRAELALLDGYLARHRTWGVSVHRDLLTAARVRRLRRRAEVVMTWPVDSVDVYDRVVGQGVNAVISNDLAVLRARSDP